MTALSTAAAGFQTGDIVICYYPQTSRFLHLTTILDETDSPTGRRGFVHAGDEVEFSTVDKYKDYAQGNHGFLHLRPPVDGDLAIELAKVAKTFATTMKKTPYGKHTGFEEKVSGSLNRFAGMKATGTEAEIAFDFTALVRMLKWANRANAKATLSEKRGITCAAFICACVQSAALIRFLRDKPNALEMLKKAASQSMLMLETKAALRERTGQQTIKTGTPKKPVDTGVYVDRALRANSNRQLKTGDDAPAMTLALPGMDLSEYFNFAGHQTDLDKQWFYVQTELLGVDPWLAEPLAAIIPSAFLYDVKYMNSAILTRLLVADNAWTKTVYATY